MRRLLPLGLLMVMACAPTTTPVRSVDTAVASAVWQDVPVPQGAVLTDPSDETPQYVVPNRTGEDVMAFYMARLPERGWVIDRLHSTLVENPGLGKGFRIVVGCRTGGAFVNAAFYPDGTGVILLLQRSTDTVACPR